jgi:hypothetical protein
MPTYTVSCRGNLSGGAIVQLEQKGMYREAVREPAFSQSEGLMRHFLEVEASSPEDAILVARGALAVAGAKASDFQAEESAPGPGS